MVSIGDSGTQGSRRGLILKVAIPKLRRVRYGYFPSSRRVLLNKPTTRRRRDVQKYDV